MKNFYINRLDEYQNKKIKLNVVVLNECLRVDTKKNPIIKLPNPFYRCI